MNVIACFVFGLASFDVDVYKVCDYAKQTPAKQVSSKCYNLEYKTISSPKLSI